MLMRNIRSLISLTLLLLAGSLVEAELGHAQNGPIKILVGLPPGGAVDIAARLVGEQLQGSLGQPVVVENKPGASTRIAVQALKSSEPNGQTLLVAPDAIVTLFPHVFKKVGYDPFKDLTPISQILYWSYGFAVPEASPAKTFAEFVTLAKADPKFSLRRRQPVAGSTSWACNSATSLA
jgi:tripartite-type tricarboxylate transporter receptor subunit TctC